jgi:hypothetical protein
MRATHDRKIFGLDDEDKFLDRVYPHLWGCDAAQPELPLIVSTVLLVGVGSLLLAATLTLAIQLWRHAPRSFSEPSP